jgi:hypothetical protein
MPYLKDLIIGNWNSENYAFVFSTFAGDKGERRNEASVVKDPLTGIERPGLFDHAIMVQVIEPKSNKSKPIVTGYQNFHKDPTARIPIGLHEVEGNYKDWIGGSKSLPYQLFTDQPQNKK